MSESPQSTVARALRARWLVLSGLWLLYFSFGLIAASLAPLVPTLLEQLAISRGEMGTILSAWQFVYLFAAIPMSLFLERIGELFALSAGALLIALSAACRSFAPDATWLWLAVAIFGVGGPLISVGAPKVIAQWFASHERGLAMGVYMTGPMLGGICALTLTNSLLMPLFDGQWRQIFLLYAAVAAFGSLYWVAIYLRHVNAVRATAAAHRDKSGVRSYGLLLRNPLVLIVLLMSIGIFMFLHGLSNWLPAILIAKGISAVEAGYLASIPSIVSVIASLAVPRLARGGRQYLVLTCVCVIALSAVLAHLTTHGAWLLIALITQGIAGGSLMTLALLVLMESNSVGPRYIAAASGLFFTLAQVGGVAGPVGIGVLADYYGHFDASLTGLALVCLLLVALAFVVARFDQHKSG